ncbi:MAG: peptide chain release factor N(5)-glutamine methyltransferase [Bacteroidetes bacterium]|nr:peptide chain release factor N(5)-glutamine methyltransferase [Bacteroidota bacterium]
MTIFEAQQQLIVQLNSIYDEREAAAITDMAMENITGWQKIDRIINKQQELSETKEILLKKITAELLTHKPVQYILHEAWFCGMKFYVDENVLIPRPETEELVEWIAGEVVSRPMTDDRRPIAIFDIGSGSGCIPIALKKKLPGAIISSCDVSENTLEVAKKNAITNETEISFIHLNFLNKENRNSLPVFDIIVSNPPYIPATDKKTMQSNVVDFEPHTALFVPDNDPLIFYRAIADFAKTHLSKNGKVFVEMNEEQAANVKKLFLDRNFNTIEIKKDLQDKDRMLKATMLL